MEILPGPLALTASKTGLSHNFAASCCFTVLLIRWVKQSAVFQLAMSRSSMDKIRQRSMRNWPAGCSWMSQTSRDASNATLVFIRKPSWWQGAAPMHASRSQKNKPLQANEKPVRFSKIYVCFSNRQFLIS